LYITPSWVSNSIAKFNRLNTKLIFIINQSINWISQTSMKSSSNTSNISQWKRWIISLFRRFFFNKIFCFFSHMIYIGKDFRIQYSQWSWILPIEDNFSNDHDRKIFLPPKHAFTRNSYAYRMNTNVYW
jgi:hypothetical protein